MKPRHPIRTRHDEWVKRALSLWLTDLGDVQLDARIAGESRRGDVLYTERRDNPTHRRKLGTLGELARGNVLFEPFRNPPTPREVMSCVLKIVDLDAQKARAARRAKKKLSTVQPTVLCVITPTMSAELTAETCATLIAADEPGVYRAAPIMRTVIVVAGELATARATIWLRLLGRGDVQAEAVRQLLEMSEQDPLRDGTLRLLVAWQQSLPPSTQQSEDEREMTMNLERVYERWERKVTAKGKAEGLREGEAKGKAKAVLAVLESRGLSATAVQRKQVLACTDLAQLDAWLRAASTTLSVKALLSGSTPPPRAREK